MANDPHIDPVPFPILTEEWFRRYGQTDPIEAKAKWDAWIASRRRDDEGKVRCALRLASGFSEKAVRVFRDQGYDHLSKETSKLLYAAATSLGLKIRPPLAYQVSPTCRRIVLLSALSSVPSLSYHMSVLSGIAREATRRGITVSVHDVPSGCDLLACCEDALHHSRADAAIMLRLSPDKPTVKLFNRLQVPLVLVHADRHSYAPPVLANIIPDQKILTAAISAWAAQLYKDAPKYLRKPPVIISLPHEESAFSIRNERIDMVKKGLAIYHPLCIEVADYSFRHAWNIYNANRHALGFVCLSDDLAVGMAHVLLAANKPFAQRILGFDNSPLAKDEGITSFDQCIDDLGATAINTIVTWFRNYAASLAQAKSGAEEMKGSPQHANAHTVDWGPFRELPLEVQLMHHPLTPAAVCPVPVIVGGGTDSDR